MDSLVGKTLAHYRIVREVGRGGMATVYLAEDAKHGRQVAVKVMRPETAAAIGPERFLREIEVAARLTHPHILPLHDSGADDGHLYYVMPYITGESLRARLSREGRVPLEEALRLALEIAAALTCAHDQGLVHRDIKPENVLLSGGIALVADFGIAKAMTHRSRQTSEATVTATMTGIAGTPRYMAPEQAQGGDVDGRADVYSLACVLFEMVAGVSPFTGDTIEAVLVKRFVEPPPRLSDAATGHPPWLDAALYRAMSRDPSDRFRTMADFAAALSARRSQVGDTKDKSVAVLPFTNVGGSAEDEYFSDGITEEIINALSQVTGLRVAARTSSFSFKGKREDLRLIGEKLTVGTVLEGSVRRSGNRLRITAQLVDVADGYQIWSERYDRDLTDVFEIQDEIAAAIAARLQGMLSGERDKNVRRGTTNLEAYDLFLKGRALQYQRGQKILEAASCFEQATAIDPHYAEAWAWMSDSYRLMAVYGMRPAGEVMPRAKALAERALALDANQDEAHATLAEVAMAYERDYHAAFQHWKRALELNPGHVRARCEYALSGLACARGAHEEARAEAQRAQESDPLNAYAAGMGAFTLALGGRMEAADREARRATELDPDNYLGWYMLIHTSSWRDDAPGAFAAARRALSLSARSPWALAALGAAYGRDGQKDLAAAVYAEIQARARLDHVQSSTLAQAALGAGLLDAGLEFTERAASEHDPMIVTIRDHPSWAPIRHHPRFVALLQRIGLSAS